MAIVAGGTWSPSPSARSFSTLKTEVARYIMAPDDSDVLVVCGDGINDGVRWLNTRLWNWMLEYQDHTLVADTATYTLATLFKAPRSAELLDSNSKGQKSVDYLHHKEFLALFPDRDTSGNPSVYTLRNAHSDGLVELSCPPSSSFVSTYPTMRTHYYRKVALLVNDADKLDIPSEVESFVLWHAMEYVAAIYAPDKVNRANRMARVVWRMLIRDDNESLFTDWSEI